MFLQLVHLVREYADEPTEPKPLLLDADSIQRVEQGDAETLEGETVPTVKVFLYDGETVYRCLGMMAEFAELLEDVEPADETEEPASVPVPVPDNYEVA